MILKFQTPDLLLQFIEYLKPLIGPLLDQEKLFQSSDTVFNDLSIEVNVVPKRQHLVDEVIIIENRKILQTFFNRCKCPPVKESLFSLMKIHGKGFGRQNAFDIQCS